MRSLNQLPRYRCGGVDQVVRQQDQEGLVAHNGGSAQHGMAQTQRTWLAGVNTADMAGNDVLNGIQQFQLVLAFQFVFQFRDAVKVIFNGSLVAASDKDQFCDSSGDSLFDSVLNQWFVDNRQHFLGHGLGGGQKTCA